MTLLQTTIRPKRSQRRGIILVFVVVLLVLLAIMGTAYLASTRADLVTIRGRGAGPNANSPLLVDTTSLDNAFDTVDEFLKLKVGVADLVSGDPATATSATFRQGGLYFDFDAPGDAPGADLWLSSTLPIMSGTDVIWPWVGAPIATTSTSIQLAGFYADPRNASATGATGFTATIAPAAREDIIISSLAMPATTITKNNRVYPAFANPAGARVIAGDADGDGIADSFLIPIQLNPAATGAEINKYYDEQNGVVYYYCYRVVDNNSMLNVGTALSKAGDFPIFLHAGDNSAANDTDPLSDFPDESRGMIVTNTPPAAATTYTPDYGAFSGANYGFYRSNVGLLELIKESLSIYTGQTGNDAVNAPTQTDVRRLIDLRVPGLNSNPTTTDDDQSFWMMARNNTGGTPAYVTSLFFPGGTMTTPAGAFQPYFFRTMGDLLEQQALKRPGDPQGFYAGDPQALKMLATPPGSTNIASMHDKGGTLINPQIASSSVETALAITARASTPNFSGRTDSIWKWFPADQVRLWYEWTKNLDGFRRDTADPAYLAPSFVFNPAAAPFNTPDHAGMASVELQRSVRSILTSYNGVSSGTPMRSDPGNAVPLGMPIYPVGAIADLDAAPYGEYPASKVSAATGTKRQLWRAYWSAMTNNDSGAWIADPGTAFFTATRYAGPDDKIGERNMARIRAAIAAVNTIDLRDADEDITELDVELEAQANPTNTMTAQLHARVFGTEKRPYITEILWADADGNAVANGPYLAIEIYNPHSEAIDISNYYLGLVARAGTNLVTGSLAPIGPTAVRIGDQFGISGPMMLEPGKFAVMATGILPPNGSAFPVATPPTSPTQYVTDTAATFLDPTFAVSAQGNELVLARRRRADNLVTTDPQTTDRFDELPDGGPNAIMRMVPIETIDMRQVVVIGDEPTQYQYRRYSVDPALNQPEIVRDRWKCVYGGQFYTIDLANVDGADPTVRPTAVGSIPAWKKYASTSADPLIVAPGADDVFLGATSTLGTYEVSLAPSPSPTDSTNDRAFPSSSIQIHNFDTFLAAHPANRFPYGSPFARDIDILNVPFIGAYQIYREQPANTYTLYEQNALPTDAFLAEPDPAFAMTNPSVGRMDSTQLNTQWAVDLFNFISARQAPAHDFYPDVPKVKMLNGNTTTFDWSADSTVKLAYVGGDGPVRGENGGTPNAPNLDASVTWTQVSLDAVARKGQKLTEGVVTLANEDQIEIAEALAIIQGKININTAPPVVLRSLALTVDPATGQAGSTAAQLDRTNTMVDAIITQRNTAPIRSLQELTGNIGLNSDPSIPPAISYTTTALLNIGDLSGSINKPGDDLQRRSFNLNRISNVVTTRSDVYTVYFSVQAWTYRPGGSWNPVTDTRLVGERRGAYVLDRSQVSPATSLSIGSLRIFPIVNE